MDIQAGRRRRAKLNVESENLLEKYPFDLQMYNLPPLNTVPLAEFQDCSLERVQFLRILERATIKNHKPFSKEWKECIKADVRNEELHTYNRLLKGGTTHRVENEQVLQARRLDHLSHYALTLAYCRSEDLRRWFINREIEFFKLRFEDMSVDNIKKFLAHNHLDYKPISAEEKSAVLEDLICCTAGYFESKIETSEFYKVNFSEVSSLVKGRRVFVKRGYAYIPINELIQCITNIFRMNLSEHLAKAYRWLPNIDDDRLDNLLKNIHFSYSGKDYSSNRENKNTIDVADMDRYAKQSFPMCMRYIHESFRSTHHLKHFCRLQYGLFVKGMGVLYDDAMRYFKEEFLKGMDENKFEKNYAYNIKHQYGKVGNMTSYSPYSCMKIITMNVGPGDHHGCPFKHWDMQLLKHKLLEYGIGQEGTQDITDLAQRGHCQIACGKYFEITHGQENKNAIIHPNQYFEDSFAIKNEKSGSSTERAGFKSSQRAKAPKLEQPEPMDES